MVDCICATERRSVWKNHRGRNGAQKTEGEIWTGQQREKERMNFRGEREGEIGKEKQREKQRINFRGERERERLGRRSRGKSRG